ncbi:hypothetical protein F5Y18DRAFT_273756 [Xylariaceae sp. FL1019]|nr:hypothetical protein F5Y18DRAFT_273756 [Xylariaceae sp. FL1019]
MSRFHHLLLLLLGVLTSFTIAASAPTFCKCTCFKNSTLIQLGPQKSSSSSSSGTTIPRSPSPLDTRSASTSCTQCTRAFCLSQHLPICADAVETDVVATCFQRDSRKDQIIVWGFILGTTGLLGWAAARRVVDIREKKKSAALGLAAGAGDARRGAYAPVPRARG